MINAVIADDESLYLEGLRKLVDWNKLGINVISFCDNSHSVISVVEKEPVDLLITDISMPVVDGIELARIIRKRIPRIFIIFLTAYEEFDYARRAVELHAEAYIVKPLQYEDLIEKLKPYVSHIKSIHDRMKLDKTNKLEIEFGSIEKGHRLIEEIRDFINKNIDKELTLKRVAAEFLISPNYLSRLFKEVTGELYIEYTNNCRLDRAKTMLSNPKIKVYEVADILGYKSMSYFHSCFKAHFGISPGELRRGI